MNVIDFGQQECKKAAKLLDAFLNNELSAESAQTVAEHVESCADCAREVDERSGLRSRVRSALGTQQSSAIEARLRSRIREQAERRSIWGWSAPLAAAAVVLIGTFSVWQLSSGPGESWKTAVVDQEAFIDSLYLQVAHVMQPALGDHAHCAYYRKFPAKDGVQSLGEEFEEVAHWVREKVPADQQLLLQHRCKYRNRQYVHLAFGQDEELASVILTRKQDGESFGREQLVPALHAAGVPIYSTSADQFEIAGFETDEYLAYVVSNLSRDGNLLIAQAVAPQLDELIRRSRG